ncbi:pyroglutamyl-peptidase 1 [Ceratina calcarata]|uniref:Pyroglutamyl-peptidase 1 n=1 Tax=Ceratina calcarata TaxID=156304 RepID=A0AAJ7ND01_9HYME|nr:pyroglutamyl-peptidase 1 [Ceratina calcarata]
MEINKKHVVLVTGFGPFDNHIVNASWEAVRELNKLCANSKELIDVHVIAKAIPVSYEDVNACIPKLWEEHKPMVVLHVGVSSNAKCLTIECLAHSTGYVRSDIYGKCPKESTVEPEIFETKIDVKKICNMINDNSEQITCNACISRNAGKYLCEYIFFKSLQISPKRTLFVHVPDFHHYSSLQTAKGLYYILCFLINDVKNNEI